MTAPPGLGTAQARHDSQVASVKVAGHTAMRRPADTGSAMNRKADIALARRRRLPGMDADPNTHVRTVRPGVVGERALDRNCRRDGVGSTPESDEERVTLRIDLLAPMRRKRLAEHTLLIGQQLAVSGAAELLEQAGGALDVREQEGDGAAQTLRREPPLRVASLPSDLVSNRASATRA